MDARITDYLETHPYPFASSALFFPAPPPVPAPLVLCVGMATANGPDSPVLLPPSLQEDEPTCPSKFDFDFEFENKKLETADWKDLMLREMVHFHPDLAA